MAGTQDVLQEYLVSLGFKTDVISLRKFEDGLGVAGKKVLAVGTAVATTVLAVEAAVAAFAYSMRKMYFQAELSQSTVKNMRSMAYAGKQIGISGETMESAIHAMAQAVRLNPGLQGLVESFGIKVTGRDMSDVMVDYVKALKQMPEFVGAQYAGLFGMDPDTFHMLITHEEEFGRARRKNLEMYKEYGVDPDKAKAELLGYAKSLDELEARVSVIGQKWLISMAPAFKATTEFINGPVFEILSKLSGGDLGSYIYDITHGGPIVQKGSRLDEYLHPKKERKEGEQKWITGRGGAQPNYIYAPGKLPGELEALPSPIKSFEELGQRKQGKEIVDQKARAEKMSALEKEYGLPSGWMDAIYARESNRGKALLSPAGAKGPFGLMDPTAKQYGVTNPYDFYQSAEATAKMSKYLLDKYGGDIPNALGAYNWGEGNIDAYLKTGKGIKGQPMPAETQAYRADLGAILGARLGNEKSAGPIQVSQTNTYNITGQNAKEIGREVGREQDRTWADVVRDMKSGAM